MTGRKQSPAATNCRIRLLDQERRFCPAPPLHVSSLRCSPLRRNAGTNDLRSSSTAGRGPA
jgi:hypothetical protein